MGEVGDISRSSVSQKENPKTEDRASPPHPPWADQVLCIITPERRPEVEQGELWPTLGRK